MKKKCLNCNLINFQDAENCIRCMSVLVESAAETSPQPANTILKRALVCFSVCLFALAGFYLSMLFTSKALGYQEKTTVYRAVSLLREKGFSSEAAMLGYAASFRADDNWLNASTVKENAYAATNFPFQIVTIYPDFFTYPQDDTERAAILLHEAQHLFGKNEKDAYAYVWRQRKKLGWTKATHGNSRVWEAVRNQTKEYAPDLFRCDLGELGDCTDY